MPSGGHFVGDFNAEFRPHGEGTQYRADGSEAASGQWREGKMHGRGKHFFRDGSRFEGDFVDGERSGLGALTAVNGSVFEGEFRKGDFNGLGVEWTADGKIVKCGRWANNVLVESCPVPRSKITIGLRLAPHGPTAALRLHCHRQQRLHRVGVSARGNSWLF